MEFEPGRNVWRVARAERAAVLIDGANYFAAVRSAMIKAQRSILIAGWDIHSQTRLAAPPGRADDGYPETFAEFLTALGAARPRLDIRLLLWDYSMLYAAERDPFPTLTLRWNTPHNVRFCLDDCVPIGSSQHQKLVVIDNAIGFSGGLDLTSRRWDTNAHKLDEPGRVDPGGKAYAPFHDVQMLVDGEAAGALGELLRARWLCAACEAAPAVDGEYDPWPDALEPDFTDVDIAIARTEPGYGGAAPVHEVEQLFFDSIAAAEHSIYIENQFLTAPGVAEKLAERLRERPDLEVLMVSPETHHSWLEEQSMLAGRARFSATVRDAGGDRAWLAYPHVTGEGGATASTMVHAKVMIVDDKFLRIGSANLNNRSMGTDTECDLAIAATDATQRKAIADLRNRLVGDHCGSSQHQVAAALERCGGSLIAAARGLAGDGHSLRDIVDPEANSSAMFSLVKGAADPGRPIGAEEFISNMFGGYVPARNFSTVLKAVGAGLVILALGLVWQFVPLAEPKEIQAQLALLTGNPIAPFVVIGVFVVAGSLMFPVTVLIAATAAAFGPWFGFAYAIVGALASALVTYAIGALIGKKTLRDFLGPKLNRLRQRAAKRGVLTVAAIRMVPIAPFAVINLAAGASSIPVFDFFAGTLLGMLPGIIMISAVGNQFAHILTSPTPFALAMLAVVVAAWIAVSIGVQAMVSRYWGEER
ncbi:MAG: VTT domain-containing protein [Pseudolabrys sp.]|nr:VTT domain-containing protein [Pseudolabrys sp.]